MGRAYIVGPQNHYYKTKEDAAAGDTAALVEQIIAKANPDNKTWMVYRVTVIPSTMLYEAPISLNKLFALMSLAFPGSETRTTGIEKSELLNPSASLRDAYNLARNDEIYPQRLGKLPILLQACTLEDRKEYWRNMPQLV